MTVSAASVSRTGSSIRERLPVGRRRQAAARRAWLPVAAGAAAGGFALGMLAEFFLDPRGGRRRRHQVRDRALSRLRRGERRAVVRARRAESHALGIARRTWNARNRHDGPVDDTTLAHKVGSELYRRTGLGKGRVNINVEDGVVFLRGVLDRPEDIERMEEAARRIEGVREVENLVHMPGTPAPASRPKLQRDRNGH
jgi:osmotically-inducible protein OsmY